MPPDDRFLIIRADDAGSAPGANRAIREALRAGAVTAVGFMAVAPAFADAVELLRGELARADVGVHATLNAEWDEVRWGPLLAPRQVPSLVDGNGHFLPRPADLRSRLVLPEAVAEIRRQIKAVQAAGLEPRYLDTHMMFDRLPGMAAALAQLAAEEGLLFTASQPGYVPAGSVREPGEGGAAWRQAMRDLPAGRHQLVTHPGSDTADLRRFCHAGLAPGQIARERAAETRALCSPEFRAGLAADGIKLVRFTAAS